MSFNKELISTIEKTINEKVLNFLKKLSEKYDLELEQLEQLWNSDSKKTSTPTKKVTPKKSNLDNENSDMDMLLITDREQLNKLKKTDLQFICRKLSLRSSGTKEQLVEYITEHHNSSNKKTEKVDKKPLKSKNMSGKKPKLDDIEDENDDEEDLNSKPSLLSKKILHQKPKLQFLKNKYGNFEHTETHFILDENTKKVIGKQQGDNVVNITFNDIELCKMYGLEYKIPLNLNDKNDDKNEEVEDELLEDEEEDDEVQDENIQNVLISNEDANDEEEELELEYEEEEDDAILEDEDDE